MRCKNCKKEVNPNFLKCPHCGKPIKKKKERDSKQLALTIGFFSVVLMFVILSIFSLFFKCDYYSSPATVISVIVLMTLVPFIYGSYQGLSSKVAELFGVAVTLPFIGNWFAVVVLAKNSVNYGGLSGAYYFFTLAALVLTDIILILRSSGVFKKPLALSWISLGLGIASLAFALVYFISSGVVKGLAIAIIAVQVFLPEYTAFHILMTDHRKEKSK